MEYENDEILAAVRADYEARPASARACQLGDLMIVKPDDAKPAPDRLWIMGFNGGETSGERDDAGDNSPMLSLTDVFSVSSALGDSDIDVDLRALLGFRRLAHVRRTRMQHRHRR